MEALPFGEPPELRELRRGHEFGNRQMFLAWLQVLTHRKNVDAYGTRIVHRALHLIVGLSQAEHHRGLGEAVRGATLDVREHLERLVIARSLIPDRWREPPHGFNVMREDVGF